MTAAEKHAWELVRARGHVCFILRSVLRWGIPFACFVVFGPLLYDLAMHKPYSPRILPWPALDIAFDFVLSTSLFGYLTGEGSWRKHERDYNHQPTG